MFLVLADVSVIDGIIRPVQIRQAFRTGAGARYKIISLEVGGQVGIIIQVVIPECDQHFVLEIKYCQVVQCFGYFF